MKYPVKLQKNLKINSCICRTLFEVLKKQKRILEIEKQINKVDFWEDKENAIKLSKEKEELSDIVDNIKKISDNIEDFCEFIDLIEDVSELKDDALDIQRQLEKLEKITLFSGKYDSNDVILTIRAGAGGTDAQDWASMLLRMYLTWAQNESYKTSIIERTYGAEAGIKSATIEIKGVQVYGKLKSESGVHRLVRLSPFNSDNLRQTSFAEVEILPIVEQIADLNLEEKDLKIDTFRASGAGGQHVNTTDSAVRITHLPTNIVASCQNERSQLRNKETAMKLLKAKISAMNLKKEEERINDLRGDRKKVEWGSQVRSYTMHPYKLVKDHRTKHETIHIEKVLNGELDDFIDAFLQMQSKI